MSQKETTIATVADKVVDKTEQIIKISRNALQQMPLKERISAAKKHAVENGQMNDAMWQYQAFSLTVGELLNAAERAV